MAACGDDRGERQGVHDKSGSAGSSKDIEVKVENGVLTICGERRVEKSSEDEKQHRRESFYGTFSRSFTLPDNIDHSKIAAECKDGVLKVHIPKAQSEKKSAVSIKVD
jgi:HSP20 family protein